MISTSPSVMSRPRYVVTISMDGNIGHLRWERKKNRKALTKKSTPADAATPIY
jgi:hypothetical protein